VDEFMRQVGQQHEDRPDFLSVTEVPRFEGQADGLVRRNF